MISDIIPLMKDDGYNVFKPELLMPSDEAGGIIFRSISDEDKHSENTSGKKLGKLLFPFLIIFLTPFL